MRDIYYQSVGNPVQTDRLPATRPSTEFAPGASTAYAGRILLPVSGIAMIIGAVVLLVYRAPGYAWFDPYDLLVAVQVATQEVIATGDNPNATPDAIDKFFNGLNEAFEPPKPRRKKGKQS